MYSTFEKAVRYNKIDMVRVIIESGYFVINSEMIQPTLNHAIINNHFEMVRAMVDYGMGPIYDDALALSAASIIGDTEVARMLLTDSIVTWHWSYDNERAIQASSENGHFEVVRLLLADPRVDSSANNDRAIQTSSENGHFQVVRMLLEYASGNDAIEMASENGHRWLLLACFIRYETSRQHLEVFSYILLSSY